MTAPLSARDGRLSIAGAALLWSTAGLAIKLVPLDAVGVVFWRSTLTFLFLTAVYRPGLERWKKASFGTALAYALMILCFVSANKLTTAANAIFLQYTGPFYVLALGPWLLKERFRKADAAAIAVALGGMSLFFVGKLDGGHLAGNLLAVVSGLFFALTVVFLRRDQSRDPMASIFLGNVLAAVLALPFAWGNLELDARGFGVIVFLGIVQMGFSYILFVRGLSVVPAAEASLLGMLEPAFNPIWAFLGLGERPSGWALVGGTIVLAAVAGRTVWGARKER